MLLQARFLSEDTGPLKHHVVVEFLSGKLNRVLLAE
jgi:hypothetical protein